MHQQWLTVIGLSADFLGFCLLLREWWLAFFHESSELQRAQNRAWELSLRHFSQSNMPEAHRTHADASARVHDEMQMRSAHAAAMATLAKRKRMFVAATVLIILGFALQLIGAVPGCCPPEIVPQS